MPFLAGKEITQNGLGLMREFSLVPFSLLCVFVLVQGLVWYLKYHYRRLYVDESISQVSPCQTT